MKRFLLKMWSALKRLWMAIRRFFAWVGALIEEVLSRVFGPVWRAIKRLILVLKERIEAFLEKALDLWRRLFKTGKTDKAPEHYEGANAVPLLAAISFAAVWYGLPIPRWLGYGSAKFIVVGFAVWIALLFAWRSRCRVDRRGRIARFAKSVHRATGLRRLDQVGILVSLGVALLVRREIQLLPLAVASVSAYLALLVQEQHPRDERGSEAPAMFFPAPQRPGSGDTAPTGPTRTLAWTVLAHGAPRQHSATVVISEDELDAARMANTGYGNTTQDLVRWVNDGNAQCVEELARTIHNQCFEGAYSVFATLSCFAAACQSIPYVLDEVSTGREEYWRYPIETLADGHGDCEDTTILLAALLRRAGHNCVFVVFDDHVGLGIEVGADISGDYLEHEGRRFFYCETTDTDWVIGSVPPGLMQRSFEIVPIREWVRS